MVSNDTSSTKHPKSIYCWIGKVSECEKYQVIAIRAPVGNMVLCSLELDVAKEMGRMLVKCREYSALKPKLIRFDACEIIEEIKDA